MKILEDIVFCSLFWIFTVSASSSSALLAELGFCHTQKSTARNPFPIGMLGTLAFWLC